MYKMEYNYQSNFLHLEEVIDISIKYNFPERLR